MSELLAKLCPKEQDYFLGYYQRQQRQFLRAYIKKLANLGVESSQMAETSHDIIKKVPNRHTPISVAFDKICTYMEILQRELEAEANGKHSHLPRIMDRDMFAVVGTLVIDETIDLISVELNKAKRWVEEVTDNISSQDPPLGEGCILLDCEAPIRYGLPCKCWLFPSDER